MNNDRQMIKLTGLATARGVVSGPVFIYCGEKSPIVITRRLSADEIEREVERLRKALSSAKRELEEIVFSDSYDSDSKDVFNCYLMIVEDAVFFEEIVKRIKSGRINAESALRQAVNTVCENLGKSNDSYFRERAKDFVDVERRIQRLLSGTVDFEQSLPVVPSIIVADDLTPSETLRLPRELVLGFAMNGGSTTSHVALLARAMGVPAVMGLIEITEQVAEGDVLLIDGNRGEAMVNPDEETLDKLMKSQSKAKSRFSELIVGAPAGRLKDGGEVVLQANLQPGTSIDDLKANGARGIGLYRTEYLWLDAENFPDEEAQFNDYRRTVESCAALGSDASATIRVLDVGGDKLVRGISKPEANPFLGNRSTRYLLSHRELFKTQLRAILRASAFGKVKLLYPMIACVEELLECQEVLSEVKADLDRAGLGYDATIPVGAMIEVPAAAVGARAMAGHVDFFSIGTNDLVQYAMAADRGNQSVAYLYQPTNPAVIELVRMTIRAAHDAHIEVGVCGESAADPVVGTLWAAMGVDSLSMSASYIPAMGNILAQLTRRDLDEYRELVESLSDDTSARDVMSACRNFLEHKLPDSAL